jgi:hypothetical protein
MTWNAVAFRMKQGGRGDGVEAEVHRPWGWALVASPLGGRSAGHADPDAATAR